jgi:nicotinamidase/pyrazinamidase
VSDMLRGFLEEGYPLYCGISARSIIPNVQKLLERELQLGSRIFYACDRHAPDDPEFRMFPRHCVEDSDEAQLIPELAQYPGEIIPKRTFSSFYGTALDRKLEAIGPTTILICGVTTHICVLQAVIDARTGATRLRSRSIVLLPLIGEPTPSPWTTWKMCWEQSW